MLRLVRGDGKDASRRRSTVMAPLSNIVVCALFLMAIRTPICGAKSE
ncbi:hypothetical protein GGR44_001480 [Sphingobium fontiphilum]|uniref:Uncharacterized protein n=1 Tax=Sphingobium fontiphilum TaxID=944425 RepID=A0A7W6DI98_9SPHN|nr:hypothetical protein [Sphingobium fontiphilum]MBB3981821.1 hypothetical protein [Sphingobium fontiphilum]